MLDDGMGGSAWIALEGTNAMLFRPDRTGTVRIVEAGRADTLVHRFTQGEGC